MQTLRWRWLQGIIVASYRAIMKRTLYEVLGVDREASAEEIVMAYRTRIEELKAAPSQDNSALALVRDAHDILSDAYLRTAYDASLVRPAAPPPPKDDEPDQDVDDLRPRKWAIGVGVVLLICVAWFGLHRGSAKVRKTVAPPPAAQIVPAPEPAQAVADEAAARSPKDVYNEVSASVVRISVMDASSARLIGSVSGVVIQPGVVITNCHVAVRGTTLGVKLRNEVLAASVQVADETLNLCRLSVPGLNAPPVTMGSVWSLRPGQHVLAVGAQVGGEAAMRDGIVTALAQVDHGTIIRTTAPISAGWTGGGLFDFSGHLVGITTFHHPYGMNLNVALPADWVGQMQARGPSAPAGSAPPAALNESQELSSDLIVGRWVCFGSIPGRNGDYTFRADGRVLVTMSEGQPSDSNYAVSKRTLQFSSGAQRAAFNIESFSTSRMVWQLGNPESRVVCDRR